jgi:protein TonB
MTHSDRPASVWLASPSIFDRKDERKLGRALGASVVSHIGLLALVVMIAGVHHVVTAPKQPPMKFNMVVLQPKPGRGGGGGGSPQPAPPKKLELPAPKAVEPVSTPPPIEPPPALTASVTNLAQTLQATGSSSASLSNLGGGGRNGGIGSGTGLGLGPGSKGGSGGGLYAPGNGVSLPEAIRQSEPTYTSEAMRAKIQGVVTLSFVVQPSGVASDVKIIKSLDRSYGLDAAAVEAAGKWLFTPCKKDNKPVPCGPFEMELTFRLH